MLRKIITKIVSMGILKELSLSGLTFFVRKDAAVMTRLYEELSLRFVANDVLSLRDAFLADLVHWPMSLATCLAFRDHIT